MKAFDFRQAIEAAGLAPPPVLPSGKLIRFPGVGKSNGNRSGWAKLFDDGQTGVFGDWATALSETWQAAQATTMTPTEREAQKQRIAEAQRIRHEEEAKAHAAAAKQAQALWDQAIPAPASHLYLQRKHVQAHGIRRGEHNKLIIPVMIGGVLSSLQFIANDGAKRFYPGGKVNGGSYVIGELSGATIVVIAEGFATAASLYEATGHPAVVAFSAGNLRLVAEQLRQQFPSATIAICSDHDLSGTGQREAREAAEAIDGVLAVPEAINGGSADWNDVHVQRGLDAVRLAITTAVGREDIATMGAEGILDAVDAFLRRFVAYPSDHARVAHCLWVAHTHLMDMWESSPRLAFLSPEPGSGKTRALELTETLVPRPIEAINVSSAYFFRKISDPNGMPTMLHDEIDTIFGPRAKEHEEIRGVINAGHRRGASAGRCVVKGKQIETEELPAFCPVAMAGLGNLPDTILTRSVIVRMRRRAPGEVILPYRRRIHAPEGYQLRDRLAAWAKQVRATLNTYPAMPEGITDRNADVWEALLSVADAAGGLWPERARVAAVSLVSDAKGGQPSLGVRLLGDLRIVFGDHDKLSTVDILLALINLEEAPWGDLKGKPLDARRLANLLKPYAVLTKQIRIGDTSQKGYTREALWDAWVRYLPPAENGVGVSPMVSETSDTSATEEVISDEA